MTKSAWTKYNQEGMKEIFDFCEDYKKYISDCKTERECTLEAIEIAKKYGYRDLEEVIAANETLKPGDKVYANNRDKNIALFHIGQDYLNNGMAILGAHIDSPRIDLKQIPLYEDTEIALLDTHYYGVLKNING